ncbi:MAG: hypothetical protein IJV36_06625 [Prevotella sp.]|nr:hypothetical protein [Prevotella sp.]
MKKEKLYIEHELKSNSPTIIWQLISTAAGLARWIADEVEMDGHTVKLAWGNPLMHYDFRRLEVLERVKQSHLRMRWIDEDDDEAFLEIRMAKSDLTGDYMLLITDYAQPEDIELLRDIWDDNLHRLRHSSGL